MVREKLHLGSVRLLLRLLIGHRRAVAVGLLGLIAVDGLQLIVPKIMQAAIDHLAQGTASVQKLWILGGAMVLISVLMGGCRFVWRYFIVGSSQRIERDLRQDLYDHLQRMSPQFYDRTKVGDLMAHSSNDVSAIRMATGMGVLAAADSVIQGIGTITIMLMMSVTLTVMILIPLPLLSLVMFRFGALVHKRFTRVQEAFSRLTEKAQESLSGIRVVKSYGDERSEEGYFAEKARVCVDENIRLARIWGLFDPLIGALAMASMAILLGAGGRMVITGTISLGAFVAFTSYLNMLIWPMLAAGWVVNILQRGTASMDRLQKILSTEPDVTDGVIDEIRSPALEVRNLSFTYPGTELPVLNGISFSLPAGATLGIVGRTGSGKTTMVDLLMRLYDPPRGTVFFHGVDARDLRLEALRGLFGYVPQETFLFAMSVGENIAFGAEDVPRERIEELARTTEIHEEIAGFPQGYDTLVGERGVTLSGGQKQRVAIARALALNPRILVLDDALSSVDTGTEAALLSTLNRARTGRSNILIAHRISTVRRADVILVMDGGRVVEQGTHEDLITREGFYTELARMQELEEELRAQASTPAAGAP